MRVTLHKIFVIASLLCWTGVYGASLAHAQYGTTAEIERPLAATNGVDPTASASVVNLEDRDTAGETIQDVLPEVPGLQVSSFGSENAFVGVSLRGSEINHSDVYIGDIPLGSLDGNAIDLGLLPLGAFGSIEIYRGGAPLIFGSSAIGGVVRFVPLQDKRSEIALRGRAGSFETWELRGRASFSTRKLQLVVSGGALGWRGDFPFDHDNKTPFDKTDDFVERRINNNGRKGDGLAYLRADLARGELSLLFLGLGRARGEPTQASDAAKRATLDQSLYLGALAWKYAHDFGTDRTIKVHVSLSLLRERTRFSDPLAEIGVVGSESDNRRTQVQARISSTVDIAKSLELTLFTRGVFDQFTPSDSVADVGEAASTRNTFTVGIETRFHGMLRDWRWELRPSAQAHFSDARIENLGFDDMGFNNRKGWFPSLRVGAALGPARWFTLIASGYRGLRLPAASELFGSQGIVAPSPDLSEEQAWGVDAGFVLKGAHKKNAREIIAGTADVRFFSQWYDDFIFLRQISLTQFRAENLRSTTSRGVETFGRVEFAEHLSFLGSMTLTDTSDELGRWIPRKPRWLGRGRVTVRSGGKGTLDNVAVFFETTHVGHRFTDNTSFIRLPAQTWHGTGLQLTAINESLTVSVTLQDILDRGGTTFLGYPLPGRRLSAVIEYRKEL